MHSSRDYSLKNTQPIVSMENINFVDKLIRQLFLFFANLNLPEMFTKMHKIEKIGITRWHLNRLLKRFPQK